MDVSPWSVVTLPFRFVSVDCCSQAAPYFRRYDGRVPSSSSTSTVALRTCNALHLDALVAVLARVLPHRTATILFPHGNVAMVLSPRRSHVTIIGLHQLLVDGISRPQLVPFFVVRLAFSSFFQ